MAIKSSDGKIEMIVSAHQDKIFYGGIKVASDIIAGDITTTEISISTAEIDTVFENTVDLINIKNGDKIEVTEMRKEN